jgi:hypothetical protein
MTEPKDDMETSGIEASIADGRLTISISVPDLIRMARIGPGLDYMEMSLGAKIEIGDEAVCARSLLQAMEHSDQFQGASYLYQLIDNAVEVALEQGLPGFTVKREAA